MALPLPPCYMVRKPRITGGDYGYCKCVNQFRDNLKTFVSQVVSNQTPIKVTRRSGEAFVVVSADDWEREQETLHVLQSKSLMTQIADSLATHTQQKGYTPTAEEMNEITRI